MTTDSFHGCVLDCDNAKSGILMPQNICLESPSLAVSFPGKVVHGIGKQQHGSVDLSQDS